MVLGRVNSSAIISELIYSLSNLLVLFNDRIIEKSKIQQTHNDHSQYKLKLLLTTLEYSEVFIELTAAKLWGETGRWFFITVVQLVKCIGRLVLKFNFKQVITQSPPIMALDRKNIDKIIAEDSAAENVPETFGTSGSVTFTLKRSGRVMRKIEGAPPVYLRTWKPLENDPDVTPLLLQHPNQKQLMISEVLYILKPLIHLGSVGMFGYNSWKSFSVALFVDLFR